MHLPDKEIIREQWLKSYSSDEGALDVIRHAALQSLEPSAEPEPRPTFLGWLYAYRRFAAFVICCWGLAIGFNLAAPDLDIPESLSSSPQHVSAELLDSVAAQRELILELSGAAPNYESLPRDRFVPETEVIVPPAVLLLRSELNDVHTVLASCEDFQPFNPNQTISREILYS